VSDVPNIFWGCCFDVLFFPKGEPFDWKLARWYLPPMCSIFHRTKSATARIIPIICTNSI
jgi:hypothetical protein